MVQKARSAKVFGVVLGTLGHQGNVSILLRLKSLLKSKGKVAITFLMSELFPKKLKMISTVEVRLSGSQSFFLYLMTDDVGVDSDRLSATLYRLGIGI